MNVLGLNLRLRRAFLAVKENSPILVGVISHSPGSLKAIQKEAGVGSSFSEV